MASASLRAYRDGPDTSAARRQIVVDYLNSTPLSARAGFGEVNGLGDGLLRLVRQRLRATPTGSCARRARTPEAQALKARLYKQVLSLLLAQRRPVLLPGRAAATTSTPLTDSYLRLLRAAGVIDDALGAAALAATARLPGRAAGAAPSVPFVDQQGRQRDPRRAAERCSACPACTRSTGST